MGVATHFGNTGHYIPNWNIDALIPEVVELGVGWVRDDFYWAQYEKEKGVYEIPPRYREWIDAANKAGLKVILVFNGANKLYDDVYAPEAYAAAAANLAVELDGKVQCIEILNEPHNFGFSKVYGGRWNGVESDGTVSPWIGKYVELLNTAADAIKAANPDMKVIGLGSVAPSNFRMLEIGISKNVDGMVDHPYSLRTVPELIPYADSPGMRARDGVATADSRGTFRSQMELYRSTSAKHAGPQEIWLTEWGFPAYQEAKPSLFAGFTQDAQAKYIQRRMIETLSLGIDSSIVYALKDDGRDRHNAEHNFGLIDYNGKRKPAFEALRRVASDMNGFSPLETRPEINVFTQNTRIDEWPVTWDGSQLIAPGAVETHLFRNAEGDRLLALWSSERAGGDLQPRLVDVEIGAEWPVNKIKAWDMLTGEPVEITAEALTGRVLLKKVSAPDHPVAILFQ